MNTITFIPSKSPCKLVSHLRSYLEERHPWVLAWVCDSFIVHVECIIVDDEVFGDLVAHLENETKSPSDATSIAHFFVTAFVPCSVEGKPLHIRSGRHKQSS